MKQEMQGPTSGIIGECAWTIAGAPGDYTLVISGDGAMGYYYPDKPWEQYKEEIKTLVIRDGVTRIRDHTFCSCTRLCRVTLPDSLIAIGSRDFSHCDSLTSAVIPG